MLHCMCWVACGVMLWEVKFPTTGKNTEPMGPTDHNRLPSRASTSAISGKPVSPNKLLLREGGENCNELLRKGAIVETQQSAESFVSQIFLWSTGFTGQHNETIVSTKPINRVCGFSGEFRYYEPGPTSTKGKWDSERCSGSPTSGHSPGPGNSLFPGKNNDFIKNNLAGPLHYKALQKMVNSVILVAYII